MPSLCDPLPELAILRHLAARTYATAAEVGISCRMTAVEVQERLIMLESMKFVAGRRDLDASPRAPQRVYDIAAEGRHAPGAGNARSTT